MFEAQRLPRRWTPISLFVLALVTGLVQTASTAPPIASPAASDRNLQFRITVDNVSMTTGRAPATLPITVLIGGVRLPLKTATVGAPSDWVDLNPYLRNKPGLAFTIIQLDNPEILTTQISVELAQGGEGTPLKKLTESVQGRLVEVMLPGDKYVPAEGWLSGFQLFSTYTSKYLDAARAVALRPEERPRQFTISALNFMGGEGDLTQLNNEAQALGLLGINAVGPYNWGNIPASQVQDVLRSYGIDRRVAGVYAPPAYFDYDPAKMGPTALAAWAANQKTSISSFTSPDLQDLSVFTLADEPGWYYPGFIEQLRKDPAGLTAFRNFVQAQGLQPTDVGAASWDNVYPIAAGSAVDLPSRRLFYWSMRFGPESAARGFKAATQALETAFGYPLSTPVNYNNWNDKWYTASPNARIGNNPVATPEAASGGGDWLLDGRLNSHTLWTEDWFPDSQAEYWSIRADLLRSAAMEGTEDFGGYIVGQELGGNPAGAAYKALALVGHGAKTIGFYSFGPAWLFPGNSWSDTWPAYGEIADAVRLIGRSESVLFPGQPARGQVAILLSGSSDLWQQTPGTPYYENEGALHTSLVDAGYTVDFVDETDLANGALTQRGYRALYILGPNVSAAAQQQIKAWVAGGGVVAALPGAGTADEYNTPTAVLSPVLGLQDRAPIRDVMLTTDRFPVKGPLNILDNRFGTGAAPVRGLLSPLHPAGASILARLPSGEPAVTMNHYGRGTAFAYGFDPGLNYFQGAYGYGGMQRNPGPHQELQLAIAPAAASGAVRPVIVSQQGVEACLLQSDAGIGVVLLNWTPAPLRSITVNIPNTAGFHNVSSARNVALQTTTSGNGVRVTMPLDNVDVLMIQ